MKHEIGIEKESPFKNCKLNRKIYAEVLTEVVINNNQGFVMSLNNKWGTGKTTFVKMWQYHLENQDFQTINFNAWENDFEDNALTALLGELKPIVKPHTESVFNNVLEKGLIISKHILPILVKSLIEKYIDTKNLKESLINITDQVKDIFKNEVDEYLHRKESIIEFKTYLSQFVANTVNDDKPLVFIIDELDRCRPNYAVSLLEQIKHFFSVPNIVFVLSIDKEQLEFAIKGVYGNDNIDSEEYLRRFIDIEYSLPAPDGKTFSEYLYQYYNFAEFFEEKHSQMIGNDKDTFLRICYYLFNNESVTLRQQEKIFAHVSAVLKTCRDNRQLFPLLFVTLIYLKVLHQKFYNSIKTKSLSIDNLQANLTKIFTYNKDSLRIIVGIEANLIFFYNNFLSPNNNLFEYNQTSHKDELIINSYYDANLLLQNLNSLENSHYDLQVNSIEKIIARIDLISRD
ncbi:KAP family P-loop NTPase fold protein [Flavobacterium hydrophilum]|uniref:KAP NTPase domain-containing protein n=1 Tax=Flavobacterium hydrophilum TaxID=2211445 RepID=A0A2V4BZ39_9FLAO|nr:P-loop NTPase fold protein [Flavobacterium hydrophilum]PXY44279.1 hypothetical protein DMB68_17820 [Flavobacterium hydrophilum]